MDESEPKPSPLVVGLCYNIKKGISSEVEDIEAEYDSIDTINALKNALHSCGCKVILLEADHDLPCRLSQTTVDIIFNIAEGTAGRGREAQVPAILDFLQIPYSGSDETTLSICLDKGLTKRLLETYGVRTPKYQVVCHEHDALDSRLTFPLMVKPNAEGSSKGIGDMSVAHSKDQAVDMIHSSLEKYNQPVLVEEYIIGREFTVGVIGNGSGTHVFRPMEIEYLDKSNKYNIYSYNVKREFKKYVNNLCPAPLSDAAEKDMIDMARRVYTALECKDFSRIDFMMSEDGRIYFLEINPLPGLAPGYSEYPMIAEANGMPYDQLISLILNCALERHGIDKERITCKPEI